MPWRFRPFTTSFARSSRPSKPDLEASRGERGAVADVTVLQRLPCFLAAVTNFQCCYSVPTSDGSTLAGVDLEAHARCDGFGAFSFGHLFEHVADLLPKVFLSSMSVFPLLLTHLLNTGHAWRRNSSPCHTRLSGEPPVLPSWGVLRCLRFLLQQLRRGLPCIGPLHRVEQIRGGHVGEDGRFMPSA